MNLERDARHVCYEYKQLAGSLGKAEHCRRDRSLLEAHLRDDDDARLDDLTLVSNCFITATLVAARNLIDFYRDTSRHKDDILYVNFIGAPFPLTSELSELRGYSDPISKRLAHLTRVRHDDWGGWYLIRISRLLLIQAPPRGARTYMHTRTPTRMSATPPPPNTRLLP